MITQEGQLLFYRGAVCTITTVDERKVVVEKWSNKKRLVIKTKDISLHPKGAAWKASKAAAL